MKQCSPQQDLRTLIENEQIAVLELLNQLQDQIGRENFQKYQHLISHIHECQCHKYQADGSPCTRPEVDCHDCQKALDDLSNLRKSLKHDCKLE
ncbi:MAG: hypothetical protein HYV97_08165 [Bdellovibrio sp.]|nr:hypothetical protein [Bdellovibrio sp.]